MKFLDKVKLWISKTGLSNIGWLAGAVGGWFFGLTHLATAAFAIFLYINFNVIRKLVKNIEL
jgi:hypothetical protein